MKFEAIKQKLHDYIEHGNHDKIMAIYLLINEEETENMTYDEATINMLEERKAAMMSGKDKTYSLEQTIENLRKYRSA